MAEPAAIGADVAMRPFRPDDEEAVLRLLEAAFDGWPNRELAVGAAEHLHWKLRSSEQALRSHVVAEAGSTIVACRLFRIFDVETRGRPLRASWGSDTAVHPDFHGQRVMTRLRDFSLAQLRRSVDLQFGGNTNPRDAASER